MTEVREQPNGSIKRHFDTLGVSFFITDVEATILYANNTLEKKTGYALAELIGKTPGKLWGGNMDRSFYDRMWGEIRDKRHSFSADVMNSRRKGGTFEDRIIVSPIAAQTGEVRYYVGLHSDAVGKKIDPRMEDRIRSVIDDATATAADFMDSFGIMADDHTALHEAIERDLVAPIRSLLYRREDDRTLILAAKTDSARFGDLYAKYRRPVYDYFYHRLRGDRVTAEDLTQETFVRAFSFLGRFEQSNASYLTYLLRIAHNLLVNQYRDQKPTAPLEEGDMRTEQRMDRELDNEHVWNSVRLLSDIEREVITMKYQQSASIKEIADVLGKTENAVKLHLSRGRKKLGGILGNG